MKIIIAGTRPPKPIRSSPVLLSQWYRIHRPLVQLAIDLSKLTITEEISGEAEGFDKLGEAWARKHGIKISTFPAQWHNEKGVYDKGAGFERNWKMAIYADGLIAIWDGFSGGTADMIAHMRKLEKMVYVHKYNDKDLRLKPEVLPKHPSILQ